MSKDKLAQDVRVAFNEMSYVEARYNKAREDVEKLAPMLVAARQGWSEAQRRHRDWKPSKDRFAHIVKELRTPHCITVTGRFSSPAPQYQEFPRVCDDVYDALRDAIVYGSSMYFVPKGKPMTATEAGLRQEEYLRQKRDKYMNAWGASPVQVEIDKILQSITHLIPPMPVTVSIKDSYLSSRYGDFMVVRDRDTRDKWMVRHTSGHTTRGIGTRTQAIAMAKYRIHHGHSNPSNWYTNWDQYSQRTKELILEFK